MLDQNQGKSFVIFDQKKPIWASFFALDEKRVYHLFGATNPKFRYTNVASQGFYQSICYLNQELKYQELDVFGINSPKRGFHKLSWRAKIVPYYQIHKVLPS